MERALTFNNKQHGFVMVAVIFLIVVLAVAVVFISRFSGVAISSGNKNLLATRAELAAQAGLDWGIYQVANSSSCVASTILTVTAYSDVNLEVQCNSDSYNGSITLYNITAVADYGSLGQIEYVHRQFSATVEQP